MKSLAKKPTYELKPLLERDFRTALSLWCTHLDKKNLGRSYWTGVLRETKILGLYDDQKVMGAVIFAPSKVGCDSVHIVVSSRAQKKWLTKRLLRWMRGYLDMQKQPFLSAANLNNIQAMKLLAMLGFNPIEEHVPEGNVQMYYRSAP